jgi:tetratricopeptide (TPR) repeat protein
LTVSVPFWRTSQFVSLALFPRLREAPFPLGQSSFKRSIIPVAVRSIFFLLLALSFLAAVAQTPKQESSVNADELLRAGIAAQRHGDNQSAIEDFRKALAIQPRMVEALAGLGEALAATGHLDEAIEEDTRALAAAPDKTAVRMNLAMAYYKKGDLARAREQFETLHAAIPRDVSAAVMLGYVYIKLGREAAAADLLIPLEAGH